MTTFSGGTYFPSNSNKLTWKLTKHERFERTWMNTHTWMARSYRIHTHRRMNGTGSIGCASSTRFFFCTRYCVRLLLFIIYETCLNSYYIVTLRRISVVSWRLGLVFRNRWLLFASLLFFFFNFYVSFRGRGMIFLILVLNWAYYGFIFLMIIEKWSSFVFCVHFLLCEIFGIPESTSL